MNFPADKCQRVAIGPRPGEQSFNYLSLFEPTGNLDTKTSIEIMDIFGAIQAAGQYRCAGNP